MNTSTQPSKLPVFSHQTFMFLHTGSHQMYGMKVVTVKSSSNKMYYFQAKIIFLFLFIHYIINPWHHVTEYKFRVLEHTKYCLKSCFVVL